MPFFLIKKPKGKTSTFVVDEVKKNTNAKKAGHSGTLDPFATGLMIVATNEDTKFLDKFLKETKTYSGNILFGKQTTTLDPTGEIIVEKDVDVSFQKIKEIIEKKFIGEIEQIPPAFSAIRINGKRSYNLARTGKQISHLPVKRIIYKFDFFKFKKNEFKFIVKVSSGTYIRSLAKDLGEELNVPAMLVSLKREKIGNLSISDASTLENLIPTSAKKILKLTRIFISKKDMKKILEGKLIFLNYNENELLVENGEDLVLLKKIKDKKIFKILKRIK